ncbi:MAG: arsenate reductase (glutaredoxin) [Candidatus Eisenbacteria bacterium]|uniref:Arsenate reductase (Glutaredoxin) n=1 Tax=Eiseniibacteriota bacterium TaxID=2212470 RepID=A0A956RT73_UNCEI|nr:arsenate reductase (glutaredoxin) [Candidatus Eisenbacteria bacterium]
MRDDRILVYEKPTCTTCRKLVRLLQEEGVDFDRVDYFVEPLSRRRLKDVLAMAGLTPREVLRTRESAYGELGLSDPSVSDERILDALVAHPGLLQRPIVVRGKRAVLARPVERVRTLFD